MKFRKIFKANSIKYRKTNYSSRKEILFVKIFSFQIFQYWIILKKQLFLENENSILCLEIIFL